MVYHENTTSTGIEAMMSDPLLVAIEAYRNGRADYDAAGDDFPDDEADDLFAATIKKPELVLSKWRDPATSHEAALAAVALADDEIKDFGESPIADAMNAAAIRFWKENSPLSSSFAAMDEDSYVSLKHLSPDVVLTPLHAAAYLRVSLPSLARWRIEGSGPAYLKRRGRVFYQVSAMLDYVAEIERHRTRADH